jgi:hypothetical protein
LTGSFRSIVFYKKKLKQRYFSKKKNQLVVIEFLTGSCRINPPDHNEFFLFLFFLVKKKLWADNSAAHCSIGMAYIKYFSKFSPIAYYQGTSTGKNRQEEPHNYLICIYIA